MKEVGTRSKPSGTVVKKKTSSGCLIIKKKVTDSATNASSSRNPYKHPKEKAQFVANDTSGSESSDSASESGSGGYSREFETRKRGSSGLDVFEFDEYDKFDPDRIRKLYRQSGASRFEAEDDESDLPLSALRKKYRLASGKAIRVQGKNGVLKVMVNDNKRTGVSRSSYDRGVDGNLNQRKVVHEKMSDRDSDKKKKKSAMTVAVKSKEKSCSTVKNEVKEKSRSTVKIEVKEVGGNGIKGNVNRGSGTTEKQILREKIKDMLVGAGWTIDYRPRRNRAYMDAVYISPSGTGYWSIIKAYDAFQKEEEDDFTPVPDEVLAKLTRQTQKKTEREMISKRKSEDDGEEENLSSYGRKSRKLGRCTLLVREAKSGDGFVPYLGKRTLLSWLVDSGVVNLREHVEYMNRRKTRILQKGWIAKDGIHCDCCSKIVTVLKFEDHAGSKLGHPYPNIFLESGKSLMQCQIDAWNKQGELERKGFYNVDVDGEDPNDDTCGLCGDGGDLICCDGCPSTFHQTCLELPMLPQGDWFCPNCSCKYCDIACTDSTQASLLTCHLCQKKYHESCMPEIDIKPTESSYPNLSFCGLVCHELYSQLQKLVGVKHELDSGFSWSLIQRSEISMDAPSVQLSQRVEGNSKLAVAMSLMDECFLPFTDRRSGVNLIRNIVFSCGSNLSRLNYSSFFTAVLERGDEVVCAASIRIHGTRLAEMPFIGTRHIYRRQGMCRRLLSAIEVALSSLQVEKLTIPAVPEHMDTWTDVFGFHPLEESDKQKLRCMNMVVFPKTDMLQKPLLKVAKTDSVSRDDAGTETPRINSPCEPKLSGSTDAHPEPEVGESTVQVANEIETTSELQLPKVESVSMNLCSNGNIAKVAKTDSGSRDDAVTETPPISSPCEPKLSGSVDAPSETDVDESTVHVANETTAEPQLLKVESVSMNPCSNTNIVKVAKTDSGSRDGAVTETQPTGSVDAHSEPDVDESTVHVANETTAEPQLLKVESVSMNPCSNANIVKVAKTDSVSRDGAVTETPPTGSVDAHSGPDVDESTVQVANETSAKCQLPKVESVSMNPCSNANIVKVAKTDSGFRDGAVTETPPINSPSEPKLSGSVDAPSDPDVDESAVHVADKTCSNASLEETDVQNAVSLDNSVPSDAHCESVTLDASIAIDAGVKESSDTDAKKDLNAKP